MPLDPAKGGGGLRRVEAPPFAGSRGMSGGIRPKVQGRPGPTPVGRPTAPQPDRKFQRAVGMPSCLILALWDHGGGATVDSVNWRGDGYGGGGGGVSKLFPVDSEGCSHGLRVARDPSFSSSGHRQPKVPGSRPQKAQNAQILFNAFGPSPPPVCATVWCVQFRPQVKCRRMREKWHPDASLGWKTHSKFGF
jgi:hypothetical protein